MLRIFGGAVAAAWLGLAPAHAVVAAFPSESQRTANRIEPNGSYALPIGPWDAGSMLTRRTEGRVEQTAWKLPQSGATTLELIAPLRENLEQDGWKILYECETQSCGGFDFRYATQVLPEPVMHVDLGDFRFVSARRGAGAAEEHASVLVSRSVGAGAGYIQLIHVMPAEHRQLAALDEAPPSLAPAPAPNAVGDALEKGAIVLEGLSFATGGAELVLADPKQMQILAGYLAAHQDKRVALVGHTDASGTLEANVALSRRRAEAVRDALISKFGVARAQLTALGAGFMSPRASNQTEEGRGLNRRVEVILTTTH